MENHCGFCKKVILPDKRGRILKFCSRQCSSNSQKNRVKKTCLICHKNFEVPKSSDKGMGRVKCCSAKCRQIYTGKFNSKTETIKCELCSQSFEVKPSSTRRFCCVGCFRDYQRSSDWKQELQEVTGRGKLQKFREQQHSCFRCNSSDEIAIHHADGNARNNVISNWIPLCRNCHHWLHSLYDVAQKNLEKFTTSFIKFTPQ